MNQQRTCPRSVFPHGNDCEVVFLRRADNKNAKVEIYRVTAKGKSFIFQMMKMRSKHVTDPWVFGSFSQNNKQVWTFRDDIRVKRASNLQTGDVPFRGDVYTHTYKGVTYALYVRNGSLEYVVPFVTMLMDPSFDPDEEDDINVLFDHYYVMRDIAHDTHLQLAADVQEVLDEEM